MKSQIREKIFANHLSKERLASRKYTMFNSIVKRMKERKEASKKNERGIQTENRQKTFH